MMAKPIRALELHYPMIQFLIINLDGRHVLDSAGSSRKRAPLGREKGVLHWSWPVTGMVLVSGHERCRG